MRTISERTADQYLRFSRIVRLEPDISHLAEGDLRALKELIEAADLIDQIFLKQDHPQSRQVFQELLAASSTSPRARKVLKVFQIFNGPIGVSYKTGRNVRLVDCDKRPAGGTLYPPDLTPGELRRYKRRHPEQAPELESHFTVVRRHNGELVAIPYHQVYGAELEVVAEKLGRASVLASDTNFRKYLASRANALLSGDYYQSDLDWLDCEKSPIDITIGPMEYYGDDFDGKKAFYEAQVTVKNQEASEKLNKYRQYLQQLENNIPFHSHRDLSATVLPMDVVDVAFRSGWCKSGGTGIVIAQILPNDEKIAQEKGRKISFFKNIMEQRFGERNSHLNAFLAPEFRNLYSGEAYYEFVIGHEISHALGPKLTKDSQDIKIALGNRQTFLEEMKASCLAMYNLRFLMQEGFYSQREVEQIYASRVFSLIPFCVPKLSEAHRLEDFLTLSYFLSQGGVELQGGLVTINFAKAVSAIGDLAQELLAMQFAGDVGKADEFIKKYFRPDDEAIKHLCQKKQSLKLPRYYILEQPLAEKLAGRAFPQPLPTKALL